MNLGIIGIAAALTSAASWALGSILFKKIGEKVSPFGMTLTKGILGIFLLGAAYAIYGFEFVPINAAGMLIISGIIGIAVGDTLFFAALQYLGPKVQIIFFMLGQVMTALLGLLILKEMPLLLQWKGIAVHFWEQQQYYGRKYSVILKIKRQPCGGLYLAYWRCLVFQSP